MKRLQQFISSLQHYKTEKEENAKIEYEIGYIREQFKELKDEDNYHRREYICELMYMNMIGFPKIEEIKEGIEQCKILICKSCEKEDNKIGFYGLKNIYENKLVDKDFKFLKDNFKIEFIQEIGELLSDDEEYINMLITYLNKNKEIEEINLVKILNCILRFVNNKEEINRFNQIDLNLLFVESSLKNSCRLITIIKIFIKWNQFDSNISKRFKKMLITKFKEVVVIVKSINKWIETYNYLILNFIEIMSNFGITIESIKEEINYILLICISTRIKNFNNKELLNSKFQILNSSLLIKSLSIYDDKNIKFENLLKYLKYCTDINVKTLILDEIIKIIKIEDGTDNNLNNSFDEEIYILKDFDIWKRLIYDKDEKIKYKAFKILEMFILENEDENLKFEYNDVKNVLILLLHYLQICKNDERKEIFNCIIKILEKFQENKEINKLVEESIFKILKIFITIGNCDNKLYERIFKLIVNNVKYKKEEVIEFIIKGLKIGCCENFIKLSKFILEFNLKNDEWKIGVFDYQLNLLIKKYYQNNNLIIKILILESLYNFFNYIKDDNKSKIVKLFNEELNNNESIEIKQRIYEFLKLIELNIYTLDNVNINDKLWVPNEGYNRFAKFDQGILHNDTKIMIKYRINREDKIIEINFKLKESNNNDLNIEIIKKGDNYSVEKIEEIGKNNEEKKIVLKYNIFKNFDEFEDPEIIINKDIKIELAIGLKNVIKSGNMTIESFNIRKQQIIGKLGTQSSFKHSILIEFNKINQIIRCMNNLNFELVNVDKKMNKIQFVGKLITELQGTIACLIEIQLGYNGYVELYTTIGGLLNEHLCRRVVRVIYNSV